MRKILKAIRRMERIAYPPAFRQMQYIRSMKDLEEYCEGTPRVKVWETGYVIVTEDEIVDMVSLESLGFRMLNELKEFFREHFGRRRVYLDARASTSYPLLLAFAKRDVLEIEVDDPWDWDGETFHELEIRFR